MRHLLPVTGWAKFSPNAELQQLVGRAERTCKLMFSLPDAAKHACQSPQTGFQSGWRPSTAPHRPTEVWHISHDDPAHTWPSGFLCERGILLQLLDMAVLAVRPMIEMAIKDSRPSDSSAYDTLFSGRSVLRLLFYRGNAKDWRFGAHTDLGLATIFLSQSEPGLELLGLDGKWHAVGPDANSWIAIGGEIFAILCGNRRLACRHRVRICPRDRYAIVLFIHPSSDLILPVSKGAQTVKEFFEDEMRRRKRSLRG
jgi:2OG-Fe(II) oxygenase superfamily